MKTHIRFVAVLLLCLISSTALADIVMPESLHRIGYEVLVYATGAAAALGGGLLARYRKRKVRATAEPMAEWKTEDCVTAEERNDIEAKLNAGIPFIKDVFDQRYEELLPKWLAEDKKLPKRYTFPYHVGRNRMSEWKSKNETLLKEILVSDGELVQRFTGVPLEYLRDRLMKPMPDDFTAGWFAGDQFSEIWEIKRKYERRRKIIRTSIQALVLVAVGVGEYFFWRYPLFRILLCGNLTCVILSVGGLSFAYSLSEVDVQLSRLTSKNDVLLSRRDMKWMVWRQFASSKLTLGIVAFLVLIAVDARVDIDQWHWIAVVALWVKILSANLLWIMSGLFVSVLFARVREFCAKFVKHRHSRQQQVEERSEQMALPGTLTGRLEHSEDTVPFICDDVHKQPPLVVGEQGRIAFGRSRRSDVRLDEQDVSGKHVEIVREGDQILAVCLSHQGMFVNDKAVEPSGRRQLHEGDCMRIGMKAEVHVVRLPKDGDDVMVLNVKDSHGTRDEEVRLPMVADGASLRSVAEEDSGHGCGEDAQHSLGVTRSASPEELAELRAHLCVMRKPAIYLYPEKEATCNAKVITDGALTCTYPAHGAGGWRGFVAAPDGTLTFPDGRKFYCLYWEGTTPTRWDFSKGYCVRGGETGEFLADILAKMGLSFREANEFIIYWLPKMQKNPYNVIAFQGECYSDSAKLEIEPRPDSVLRVFMAWKASDSPVDIAAPDITPFERKGFTVVEWGGAEVGK